MEGVQRARYGVCVWGAFVPLQRNKVLPEFPHVELGSSQPCSLQLYGNVITCRDSLNHWPLRIMYISLKA